MSAFDLISRSGEDPAAIAGSEATNGPEPNRQHLKVLLVEDYEDDALLVIHALRAGGYELFVQRVECAQEMREALRASKWDLILSDFRLPEFTAHAAFAIYREFGLDIPFLIVSGVIGEETAVAAMKAGVHDYVNKDNLARLVPAVRRELREAESRRERARAEEALHAAYAQLAAIHASVPVLLLVVDEEFRVTTANDLASRFSGTEPPKVAFSRPGDIIGCINRLATSSGGGCGPLCTTCPIQVSVLDTLATGTRHENVEAWVTGSGAGAQQSRCLLITSSLLNIRSPKTALVCAQDITELKRAHSALERSNRSLDRKLEEIQSALAEKEVLFKEVQHRVKNNLQVISSLLSLQAVQAGSEQARAVLAESRDRVRSLALMHEQLCFSGHMAEIEFSQYIDRLARYLVDGYVANSDRIQVHTDVDVVLSLDQAMPCGLIVQELLSNSLKHAFPKEAQGEIRIEFHQVGRENQLLYGDNGIGLPPEFDLNRSQSLGMQLISDLTAQLHGQLSCFNARGAQFRLSFPSRNK
jgi:two-component sensor histidine kinase/DNA-binding response OmpR family regulator